MQIPEIQKILETGLSEQLKFLIPNHPISEVYEWACIPPGKLFRPLLSAGVYLHHSSELISIYKNKNSNPSKLAAFLELHHSYTLVHDDLPCMDDDDERRGKTSTHKKYGEWKALLVGDGLMAASWRLLSLIDHPSLAYLFRYTTWSLGPKGLLQGQVLDLSEEMTQSFENLLLTHKLKTARLIQCSLVAGYLISPAPSFKQAQNYHRLGEALGISFQLLDDLTELTEKLGDHELKVNPWLWACDDSYKHLVNYLEIVKEQTPREAQLLTEVLSHYFGTIYKKIEPHRDSISKYLSVEKLRPIESLLKTLGNIQ